MITEEELKARSLKLFDKFIQDGYDSIKKLIEEKGWNVNEQDKEGNTFLHFFSRYQPDFGHIIIKLLIEDCEASPYIANNEGNTPLHTARYKEAATVLVEKIENLNITNNNGFTPLFMATLDDSSSSIEILKILLDKDANPNIPVEKRTALDMAIYFNSLKIHNEKIQPLKSHGALTYKDMTACQEQTTGTKDTEHTSLLMKEPAEDTATLSEDYKVTKLLDAIEAQNIRMIYKAVDLRINFKDPTIGKIALEHASTHFPRAIDILEGLVGAQKSDEPFREQAAQKVYMEPVEEYKPISLDDKKHLKAGEKSLVKSLQEDPYAYEDFVIVYHSSDDDDDEIEVIGGDYYT